MADDDGEQQQQQQQQRERMESLDLQEDSPVVAEEEEEEEEEEEDPAFLARQQHNPCAVIQNLSISSLVPKFIFQKKEKAPLFTADARVVRVSVSVPKRGLALARNVREYTLKATVRYPDEECELELTVGGSLTRQPGDFDWIRRRLAEDYAGCVVPPIIYDEDDSEQAKLYERFLAQCVEHPELTNSADLRRMCSLADAELKSVRRDATFDRPPVFVRVGALVLDVVGDASSVASSNSSDDAATKRREADVRELYAWAKEQVSEMTKCEKECTKGVEALKQFEAADKTIRVKFFKDDSESVAVSGPSKALAATRELVGLAKALCEAIEARERLRRQLVAAGNALELSKASESARRVMLQAAESQAKAADSLYARAAISNPPEEPTVVAPEGEREEFGHGNIPAESDLDAPIIVDEKEEEVAAGEVETMVVTRDQLGAAKLAVQQWSQQAKEAIQNTDRQRAVAVAKSKAIVLGSLGLRVVSKVALGAARVSADGEDVKRASDLVDQLKIDFKKADARLTADAPLLKTKWDQLQLQAFESFAVGEQNRADLARANADNAALKLAAAKATSKF